MITQLRGIKDYSNSTHLIYQIKQSSFYENADTTFFDFYNYDITNQAEQKLFESLEINSSDSFKKNIVDFYFIGKDISKFIVLYNQFSIDTTVVLLRYDNHEVFIDKGTAHFMQVINDTVWIGINNKIYFSDDYGISWKNITELSNEYFLLFMSQFDSNNIFLSRGGQLFKSNKSGDSFKLVNDGDFWYYDVKMVYDKDKQHIYALTTNYEHKDLLISNNRGEVWYSVKLFLDENSVLTIDDSISGLIYYADGNEIYFSNDYGKSFKLITKLSEQITGLYKKSGTDFLYCSTNNKIYEIVHNNNGLVLQRTIRIFPIKEVFKLYPMAIGNKWVYHTTGWAADIYWSPIDYIETIEVIGDTIVNSNLYCYKIKKNNMIYYENVDSSNGKIYSLAFSSNGIDYISEINLNAFKNDWESIGIVEKIHDSVKYIFGRNRFTREFNLLSLNIILKEFVAGIGLYREERAFDFGYTISILKGCIINGIVYGDTTKVGIKTDNKIPVDYVLYQNYPNPFNSETTIKFLIPEHCQLTLTIYDLLGRELITLLNKEVEAGTYEIKWNADNFSNGVYFYALKAGEYIETKKMILLK